MNERGGAILPSTLGSDQSSIELLSEQPGRYPYYIVSPPYTRLSAGIRVLHTLCAALNRMGERAYILLHPLVRAEGAVSPWLGTPLLTQTQVRMDFEMGMTPITIYPEVIGKNIFRAPVAFEYLLNFRGALGQGSREPKMSVLTYSEAIRRASGGTARTLFIPTSDPRVFHPPARSGTREGVYYYAAKYRLLKGTAPQVPETGAIEIVRDGSMAQSQSELVSIYCRARRIYVYENTAVMTEAAMCGCPVVCMPNNCFQESITRFELGDAGIAWGNSPDEIARAERTVTQFFERYLLSYGNATRQLREFVVDTQRIAANTGYRDIMRIPALRLRQLWNIAFDVAARAHYKVMH
jgi:hypothetical protein